MQALYQLFQSVIIATLVIAIPVLMVSHAQAEVKLVKQTFDSAPHQLVQQTTVQVLDALQQGVDPAKEPEKFVQTLSLILDPVIAFDYIARGVLGDYAKRVDAAQVKQFAQAFKLGLVNTYGKGMAGFTGFEIAVLPPKGAPNANRTVVVQEVRGNSGVNQVSYSMLKNRQGVWKVINVVLNGVNLGQTFRSQFAAAVAKNQGDVAKTIVEWGQG